MSRIAFIISGLLLAHAAPNQMAWLHGKGLDMHGAAIPGVRLSVSSAGQEFTFVSDTEGRFNCNLPTGIYTVVATGANILPYRRATLNLQAAQHKYVVIRPVFHAPSDQESIRDPEIRYRALGLANGEEAIIRYSASTKQADTIVFHGNDLMLTLGYMAIYARELSCSTPVRLCTARGGVMAEIENEQMQGESVTVDLVGRTIVLTRNPRVTKHF